MHMFEKPEKLLAEKTSKDTESAKILMLALKYMLSGKPGKLMLFRPDFDRDDAMFSLEDMDLVTKHPEIFNELVKEISQMRYVITSLEPIEKLCSIADKVFQKPQDIKTVDAVW